jgi:nucleoside-diphosphate kinase
MESPYIQAAADIIARSGCVARQIDDSGACWLRFLRRGWGLVGTVDIETPAGRYLAKKADRPSVERRAFDTIRDAVQHAVTDIAGQFYASRPSTLAIIKPDAFERRWEIRRELAHRGYVMLRDQRADLDRETAEALYAGLRQLDDASVFPGQVDFMLSGSVVLLELGRSDGQDPVATLRAELGPMAIDKRSPNSLRAIFGDPQNARRNALHASDSLESADRELSLLFDYPPMIAADFRGLHP